MSTRLYVVRHGQSEYNLKKLLQGQIDSPLTDYGINQATEAKKYLSRVKFDSAYSSDLKRAYKTGQVILGNRDIKITKSKKLRERTYGTLEGKPSKDFKEKGYFTMDIHSYGGENEDDILNRAIKEFTSIAKKEDGHKVLVTTHETVILYLLKAIDPIKYQKYHDGDKLVGNCSTTVLEYKNGKFKIIKAAYDGYMK